MSVDVGSKAPDFTLTNQDRQAVTLSEQRGRPVVLAFFPAAFSSVCEKELCTFRDALEGLNAVRGSKAQVYGISVDTFFALKAFQRLGAGDQRRLDHLDCPRLAHHRMLGKEDRAHATAADELQDRKTLVEHFTDLRFRHHGRYDNVRVMALRSP